MRYGLVELDIATLPERMELRPEDHGLGIMFRDRGRLVGFKMIPRRAGQRVVDARALVDLTIRQAAAVERLRDELGNRPGTAPSLTAAICSKGRPDGVERLLASLRAVGDAELDVLVVENGPAGGAMRAACAERGARYSCETLEGLDFARNRALREARGDVVCFLDDDVVVDRNWLWAMRRAWAENPDAGCVTGLVLPLELESEAQVLFELRGGFRRGFRPVRSGAARLGEPCYSFFAGRFGAGANMSVRRALMLRLGGFDEALDTGRPLPGGGDLDAFFRVLRSGAKLVYEPQAAVYHEHRRDMAGLRRQYRSWGTGLMAFAAKSMRNDPATKSGFRRLIAWWFAYQGRRALKRLGGAEAIPLHMILGEVWGGVVGLCGEYRRSERRSEAVRAPALCPPGTDRSAGIARHPA